MTYCLGILLPAGLVLASDSRTNAGVDQIASVRKLAVFEQTGERVIALLSAGNLGTTQSVVALLRQGFTKGYQPYDLATAPTMFDAARLVGDVLREVMERDGNHVRPFGDPGGTFILGGQISGEAPRLFQIYTAGDFIEASTRTQFLQIGENKYGKPILDRALHFETSLADAAKLALLSFDATVRSNLSVAPPFDMLCYVANSFNSTNIRKFKALDPYLVQLREGYSSGLLGVVQGLPNPPIGT